ncbi:hypothetical protein EJV47_12240 [Hymenobacter gummosus]|uniref:Uncharacterized protein n=1 Tax=Hymenobacter gummosus TaxID=1776032 RepID=A0A3S0JA04_9BACT|nr:polysaccharide biosynthesis C-terminal domain-containing protein [Hymenobacter gummosus]RTQ49586.1 hypothetical protein EJV47_12240 [Hymenobacter gummosus]
MIRRILFTFTTRLGSALLNFGIVWLTARWLGATGRGQVSLFVTDTSALLLFIGLVGGSSLMYLVPRRNLWHLLAPAYCWAAAVCLAGTAAVWLWRDTGPAYAAFLLANTLLQAFGSINQLLLLGRRHERLFNALTLVQGLLLGGGLLVGLFGLHWREPAAYYAASVLMFGLIWLLTWPALLRQADRPGGARRRWRATARELARHSRGAHFSNIVAFANYRLSYYLIEDWSGTAAVGVLSVGVALAEAIWLIPRSISQVQYVDIIHRADGRAAAQGTARALRLTLLLTTLAVAVLTLLPAALLQAVFGPEFGGAQRIIVLLAPGVVAYSGAMQLSAYFAGLARYRVNNLATLLGLGVTVAACALLIPRFGPAGAALATSLCYLASTLWLLRAFRRASGMSLLQALLPQRSDVAGLRLPGRNKGQ